MTSSTVDPPARPAVGGRSLGRWLRRRRTSAAPASTPVRPTFTDPEVQASFERDGYVVVDLLGPDQVDDLRRRHDALDHEVRSQWPFVDGFDTTLYDGRRDYRQTILADFEAVIAPALDRHLADHRIMFANYAVKVPGAKDVPLHVDWTFLDEDRFRSVTVWCPLTDTSVAQGNGPLGVVVGSSHRIDFLRVVNVPCYDRCQAAVADLEQRVLEIGAGQAIVMDNRTVHYSLPNDTDEHRVVAACVVGPSEADLHHYWLDQDDDELVRYTIDQSFYLSYQVGRPAEAEGVLRTDRRPNPDGAP